jgi:hypothetical protein
MAEDFNFEWSLFSQCGKTYDEFVDCKDLIFTDDSGTEYRNLVYNTRTKTLCYEMKKPNERWAGVFHGRLMKEFKQMTRSKNGVKLPTMEGLKKAQESLKKLYEKEPSEELLNLFSNIE